MFSMGRWVGRETLEASTAMEERTKGFHLCGLVRVHRVWIQGVYMGTDLG